MAPQSPHHRHHPAAATLVLALCVAAAYARSSPRGQLTAATKAQANTTDLSDQFLAPQNKARATVGVGLLQWSAALTAAAGTVVDQQQQQQGCAFADMAASPYGANQGWASYNATPAQVVGAWVAQGKYYIHANNSCVKGQRCGTYTQVVWRRTAEVGCAQATCATGATLTLCLYNPHGNVQGESPY